MSPFLTQTFHCSSPRKMTASKMDPSCTIGFYCGNNTDLEKLIADLEKVLQIHVHVLPLNNNISAFLKKKILWI